MQIEENLHSDKKEVFLPGDLLSDETGFISGTNTYEEQGKIFSSTTGTINQTNKLIMIKPIKCSYQPQIGEIVIGQIVQIRDKKWIVNIGSSSEATLHLNSTYLPEQRQKTEDDEMNMRQIFSENDLICAEVHSVNNDKSVNLHTRGLKYGKIEDGLLIKVNHYLIVKQKRHFIKLNNNVNMILGHNGQIYLSNQDRTTNNQKVIYCQNYTVQQRIDIANTGKAIKFLQQNQFKISQTSIEKVLNYISEKKPQNDWITLIEQFFLEQKSKQQQQDQ
ncbi:unnamed protein product [Paramecium primaurelia]|uniref:S1 motif domain-containing protein n=1 Tax=Paramecium primaurelia TaxID=5886 RepID=A0A8S1KHD5_PARPR|nr:unnamed protein product [Paramecium primaurelia]